MDNPELDPVARSDALDQQIIAVPRDQVFTKPVVVAAFLTLVTMLAAGFTFMYLSLRDITASTNDAVRRQVPALEQTIEDYEVVLDQALDAIAQLAGMLVDAGIDPPEIILRPPEGN